MSDTRRQVARFLVVGVAATLADALVYSGLLATVWPGAHDAAKGAAFVVGTLVSYTLNKRWTFGVRERSGRQAGAFFSLYALSFGLNVGTNRAALELLTRVLAPPVASTVAFVVATGASTVTNFLGQRYWVFRARSPRA